LVGAVGALLNLVKWQILEVFGVFRILLKVYSKNSLPLAIKKSDIIRSLQKKKKEFLAHGVIKCAKPHLEIRASFLIFAAWG